MVLRTLIYFFSYSLKRRAPTYSAQHTP